MTAATSVQERNRLLARHINDEAKRDPKSPFTGKFVGIANGKVAAIADDLDELVRRLQQVEPDPSKTFCLEAGLDYDQVQEIWSTISCHGRCGRFSLAGR
jgi:hypothetical protein